MPGSTFARRQILLGGHQYWQRLRATSPSVYWPLADPSGAVATDLSGNSRHGAYSGVDLGQPGIGDRKASPFFDGSADLVNVYSASLAGAFNGAEGSLFIWAKVESASVWTDATQRGLITLQADSSNLARIVKSTTSNRVDFTYTAGGTTNTRNLTSFSPTDWFVATLTWNKAADRVRAYANGVQVGSTLTGLGTFAGSPSSTNSTLGANSTGAQWPWHGWLAHALVSAVEFTPDQIAALARVR